MISQRQVQFEKISSLVFERKFDTAIRKTTIKEFNNRYINNTLTLDDKLVTTSYYAKNINDAKCDGRLYSNILHTIIQDSSVGVLYNPGRSKTYQRMTQICTQVIDFQWEYLNHNNKLFESKHNKLTRKQWLDKFELNTLIQNLFSFGSFVSFVVDKSSFIKNFKFRRLSEDQQIEIKQRVNHHKCHYIPLTFVWSEKLIYVEFKSNNYILPISYLLLIYNKIHDLISVLIYVTLAEGNALPSNSYYMTISFIQELINIHKNYDEQYYSIAKTLESLCIAETLIETETWKNTEFFNALNNELYNEFDFDYKNSDLRRILQSVNTPLRHELCCLSKILGHPFVDMEQGTYDLFQKVQEPLTIDMIKVTESINFIKENYIRNHILRHGKWPPCRIDTTKAPKAIIMAQILNKDPNSLDIVRKYGRTLIHHYLYIDFLPNMRFSKLENYIPYLKDKTVTLSRTKLFKCLWPGDADTQQESWRETRLLLVYLLNSNLVVDHVNYINNYIDSEDLTELLDYLVIRIVPKEKELKIKYRGFGCKTYEDRARALAQEKSVMEFLDIYSDEQAMTLGELPLTRKLYSFRTILNSYKGSSVLYINLDASSWNNRFRRLTVDHPMSQTLDDIFGVKIFSKTHLAFEKSFIYVPDGLDFYYWDGQAGGIEGLNQDTWVVAYLGQIKTAMKALGFNYYVLCKGDDVRLAVLIPPLVSRQQSIERIKSNIVKTLKESLSKFGHKIKIEESYGSENYFSFSKTASLNTVELPQVFRKIQKSHGANNAFISTLDEYIASAFSNVHSSCKVSPNITPIYAVAVLWSLHYLMSNKTYSNLSDIEYMTLMLTPSIVGGFPIIFLHNMFVRAESDLLSPFIGMLIFSKTLNYDLYNTMYNFLTFRSTKPSSYIALYKDPYSLPLNRPTLPTTLLRKQIIPSLRKLTKNEALRELFELIDDEITTDILNCLNSCNVLNVKILSNIYAATPQGILEELLRKFETSRSVYELLILRGGENLALRVIGRVYKAEMRLQRWRVNRMRGLNLRDGDSFNFKGLTCPAQIAQNIRDILWGKRIEGITMPPLQHQLEFHSPLLVQHNTWALDNHFTYHVGKTFVNPLFKNCPQQYMSCGYKPFLGYATRSGTIAPTVHFIEKDAILIKLKNILDLISWTAKYDITEEGIRRDSNIGELLHYIIKLYSPEDISKLGPFSGKQRSGTVQHHMRSPSFKEAIVPNVLSNIYQQIIGKTNSHLKLRRSKDHFKVNFLHILCHSVSIIFQELEFTNTRFGSEEVWTVTSNCTYCTKPIKETPLVCNIKYLRTRKLRPLSLTNIGNITERLLITSVTEFEKTGIKIGEIPTNLTYERACAGVIQEFIDQTYTTRQRISERYGLINMTDEARAAHVHLIPQGRSRDIGQTEIKNIKPEFLMKYIVPKIHLELVLLFPQLHQKNIASILGNIPGNELPWFCLIDHIYKCGQLGRFINILKNVSGITPPNCFDNPSAASHYIGHASFLIQETNPFMGEFIILSNYKDTDILRHLRMYAMSCLRKIIIANIVPDLKNYERLISIPHGRSTLIRAVALLILFCSKDFRNPEINEVLLSRLRDIRESKVQLMSPDMISQTILEYDNLQDFCQEEECIYLQWQMQIYPKWNWEESYQYLKDHYELIIEIYNNMASKVALSVVYADLPTCIATVRSERPPDEILDDLTTDVRFLPKYDTDGPKIDFNPKSQRMLYIKHNTGIISEQYFHPAVYDFTTNKVILQQCYLNRPFGGQTTSQNKIIDIFTLLYLPNQLGNNLNLACLGEGYGGILELLALMTYECNILYDTLPPNPEIETYPHAAHNAINLNHHNIIYSHHSVDLYDLTKVMVMQHFESFNFRYYLTVCDAEVGDYQDYSRFKLVRNVTYFYLRNRTTNGILILKMNVCEQRNIHYVIGTLQKYCDTILMIRSICSNIGGEVYIIAQGFVLPYLGSYEDNMLEPNLQAYTSIEKFRGHIYSDYVASLGEKNRRLEWTQKTTIHQSKWAELGLESSGFSKTINRVGLPLNNDDLHFIIIQKDLKAIAQYLLQKYKTIPQYLYNIVIDKDMIEYRQSTWEPSTRRHKTYTAERWLRQMGWIDVLKHILQSIDTDPLLEQQLRNAYSNHLAQLPDRLKWLPLTSKSFLQENNDDGFISRPYLYYIEGCHIAVQLLSFSMVF
ncbi:RNA-dependent RNA polymerase [Hubei chuvirus-like virus 1]|uniref:RNA-directed RNA polymerase n=1 Tax=Hubei chuvirus-like virus 1 TaxID=1922857 RepID=A0A1L3KMX9_9VIRU|nr:RNA-dependent RNA polymerase [Hubei chuvirus-like virus 1]APG78716.1 RNA-dependent RNA polymerase [Hubei chuvirus-like virus 1]